ncbi:hypothetical protein T265_08554 [Opisthorchis viverrini]|uniref:Uncharacterized protein n=1 Tax=Opisthorchis viverrini TaxID=6198 RepID=A0A074ZJL5_OPIVI|nr:hypothetical protein T265_08554 [Opisthorchis viverrini]KER23560.1 hypothetical protein T265_08554 [Opisthorchis viverrini]
MRTVLLSCPEFHLYRHVDAFVLPYQPPVKPEFRAYSDAYIQTSNHSELSMFNTIQHDGSNTA